MIKALIDTNVLLDMMVTSRPASAEAMEMFNYCSQGEIELAVCAGSLKDAYYIARKSLNETLRRGWILLFLDRFNLFPLNTAICQLAVHSNEPDFEDGIIRACAESWNANYIISRDEKAFQRSTVQRINASQLLGIITQRAS